MSPYENRSLSEPQSSHAIGRSRRNPARDSYVGLPCLENENHVELGPDEGQGIFGIILPNQKP